MMVLIFIKFYCDINLNRIEGEVLENNLNPKITLAFHLVWAKQKQQLLKLCYPANALGM